MTTAHPSLDPPQVKRELTRPPCAMLVAALRGISGNHRLTQWCWRCDRRAVDPVLRQIVRFCGNYGFVEPGPPDDLSWFVPMTFEAGAVFQGGAG